jgi:glycosyltransferase involved in cell wall biosynthesis
VPDAAIAVTFIVDKLGTGGAERHAIALANGLDRSRFRVTFVTLKPDGGLETLLAAERIERLECLRISRRVDLAAIARLTAVLDASGADVVLATNPFATLYGILAARGARMRPKVVSTFHSTVLPGMRNQLQMLFYRAMYPFCDALIYVCENQRRYWRRRGMRAREDHMIYNGIDVEHFAVVDDRAASAQVRQSLGFGAADFVVGICAALRPEKAHGDLLRALAGLTDAVPQIRGMIIGEGPERPRIEATIAAYGLGERVRITGFQMDVRPFVTACDAMVLASHHTETFSLSALESMALGKPVVMTRTGGATEQVEPGSNGFLFEPGDIGALQSHLRTLADPATALRLGAAARRVVRERFRDRQMLQCYETLLARLAARSLGSGAVRAA